ncbi:transposase [Streptomyces chryseus]
MSLTDAQWARIEPLLPDRMPQRDGRWRDHREVIEAIAWKPLPPLRPRTAPYGDWPEMLPVAAPHGCLDSGHFRRTGPSRMARSSALICVAAGGDGP